MKGTSRQQVAGLESIARGFGRVGGQRIPYRAAAVRTMAEIMRTSPSVLISSEGGPLRLILQRK